MHVFLTNKPCSRLKEVTLEGPKFEEKKMSQVDLFDEEKKDTRQCVSLPSLSSITYRWVIMFNWNSENPFKVFERAMIKEIKDDWVKGQLKATSRAKKLMVSTLPAQTVSLFGKIDESKHITTVVFLQIAEA